jgi:hypothetical protein
VDLLAPRPMLESALGNSLLEITGRERATGQPLSLLYAGGGRNLAYLMNCLYRDFTVEEQAPVRNPFALRRAIHDRQAAFDLQAIDAGATSDWLNEDRPGVRVPPWVGQRVALSRDWSKTATQFSRSACRRAERSLRDRGYTCRFSTGTRDFFVFYNRLYQPAAKRRFSAGAVIVPRDRFLEACRRAYLLQIMQDGSMRAAVVLRRFGRHMTAGWGGVETGGHGTPAQGLSDLLDYCTIRHAWQLRCRSLDLGPTRPRLFDGVLQYKKKWGGRVRLLRSPRRDLILQPLRMNEAVAGFLGAAGFVVRDRSGPVTKLLYVKRPDTAALQALLARRAAPGMARYEIFSLEGFGDDAPAWAAGCAEPVSLVDLQGAAHPQADYGRRAPLAGHGWRWWN